MKTARTDLGEFGINRRSVFGLAAAIAPIVLGIVPARGADGDKDSSAPTGIKAMTFDIQGTVFDYYQPFTKVSGDLSARKGLTIDWPVFLVDWTSAATAIIQEIIAGKRPWSAAGKVYREALDQVLTRRSLSDTFAEADRLELMSVWGKMTPWADSVEGIERLKRKFTVAAVSNAGMAAVISISKRGDLPFDAVLTGELVRAYKPSMDVYRSAATYLGFRPEQIMMVAAHKWDLKGAKEAGFKTAYVPRRLENGPLSKVDRSPETFIDVIAEDLVDLSEKVSPV
jgi:2-haloacid dehalogenase